MFAGFVFLLMVSAVSSDFKGNGKCSDVQKVSIDVLKYIEKLKDTLKVKWSTEAEEDKCTTFQYFLGREGSETVGTTIYRKVGGKTSVHSARRSETNSDKNQWICTKDNNVTVTYYATFFSEDHESFIIVTCGEGKEDKDTITSAHCISTDKGTALLKKEIDSKQEWYGELSEVWMGCGTN